MSLALSLPLCEPPQNAKARLKVQDTELKDLGWEHEVLEQRFAKTQRERDDLYQKFIKAINEVQKKMGFKNTLLERKLHAMEEVIEKKVCVCVCVFVHAWCVCWYMHGVCVS